jgi:23S rRNA-/tRNA-specific pseudouridylate synthase
VVEVYAARDESGDISILLDRAGLLFVAKPPGLATEPDHAGEAASVVGRIAALRGVARGELHALSRLDVGVSGVVTLSYTEAARKLVLDARAAGTFLRRYVALAAQAPAPPSGSMSARIGRGMRGRWDVGGKDARPAETRYETVALGETAVVDAKKDARARPALLALSPVTGRTHQLRVHAAHGGAPLLGDPSYGGPRGVRLLNGRVVDLPRIALHAAWVELDVEGERIRVEAPFPEDLGRVWHMLGGSDEELERAATLDLKR